MRKEEDNPPPENTTSVSGNDSHEHDQLDITANQVDAMQVIDNCSTTEEEDKILTIWRCEYCRKDIKSQNQLANHMKSKKHKEKFKKYNATKKL